MRARLRWGAAPVAALCAALVLAGCGGAAAPAPPGDGAARVVPADALAFISVALDTHTGAVAQAASTLAGLRGERRALAALRERLTEVTGVGFRRGIAPWLGSQAGVALVPEGTRASELIVLAVAHRSAARRFVARVSGASARLVDGYVVIGEPAAVTAAGHGRPLASLAAFRQAESAAPADRVLGAYATGAGVAELLGGHAGLAGVVAEVLSTAGPGTLAAALAPTSDGLRLWVRVTGAHRPSARFTPSLASRLPARTTWMVDMASLTGSGPGLLDALAASSAAPRAGGSGVAAAVGLAGRLETALHAQGVALAPLASLFSHESAIFELDNSIGVMTRISDVRSARLELGTAGQALAQLFAPSSREDVEPVVSTELVGGVPVTEYQTGPSSQLDFAVVGRDVVITTSQAALAAIIDRKATLSGSSLYQSVLAGSGPSVGPVLYASVNRLIGRGGEPGLLEQLGLSDAAPALAQISAAGLTSTGGNTETTSELYFTIS